MNHAPDPDRDCPHGHQLGKCDSCRLEIAERQIDELIAALEGAPEPIGDLPSDIKLYQWWHRGRAAVIAKAQGRYVIAECWTCATPYNPVALYATEEPIHRAAGHDVRPVQGQREGS